MRKAILLILLTLTLKGFSQNEMAVINQSISVNSEGPMGIISGQVTTTDNKPAAYVSISIKGTNKFSITDENGYFTIKNVKEGIYSLEVSMVGLKAIEKTVEVKKDQQTIVTVSLEEDAKQLAAVIITARKTLNDKPVSAGKVAINPMDLPQSIAVIGQATIKEQQALRLSDVIKNVNGVYLTTTRGNVQESFAARGYSFSSTNLFKNNFRINSGVMPEMSSLERLEILKGSTAILYGQVAPGGILNMVTKQPKFQFGGEISMLAGSYDLYKPSFDIYGPINSSIAYRANATFETANSFRDVVHSKRYYINPSLLFKLGQRTELVVEGDYLKHDFTPDFGIGTLDNTKIPDLPRSRFLGASWSYNTTEQTTTTASLKHRFNDVWTLDGSTSYQFYKRDYYSTERIQATANGDWVRPLGKINLEENYYAAQANLTGKLKTKMIEHTLLTGVDADRSFTTNYDFSFPAVTGLAAGSYDKINILDPEKYVQRTDIPEATKIRKREAPINRFGVYVQDLIKLSSKFNILAGVRWSYIQTVGIDSANLLTGIQTKGLTRDNQAFSPRFGLVYKPLATTSVFASYSNSFSVNTGTDIYGNSLEPSVINQYEVGIKNDFFKGLLSANLTVYRIINNNLAQTAPYDKDGNQNSNTSIKILSGQTTSDGVELDLSGQPVKGLSILAGYSYNYMRYTKTDSVKGNFIEGERLVNNPAHTANASVFYTFSKGGLKGFKIGATAIYVGDRIGGWNNTIGQTQNYSRMISVDGYTTVDVSAGYSYKKISMLAKISNITNTLNYYVHENYSVNPLPPRQFVATVSYKF
ncbi:MAG TPA: TonB-dependent receptor [Chitinophagaceae bacterium]|jgi:iron complex outermembrane receptor protein|nr:TonB-dependent receptor [Chitinophagaceae bacterium]